MHPSWHGLQGAKAFVRAPACPLVRSERLPANLTQAQRDFFGSHTYQRTDKDGWYHTVWDATFGSADSITTSSYQA